MDNIRIGDDERRRVIDQLNAAYGQGRLELPELEERLTAATAARYETDLASLVDDLPAGLQLPATQAAIPLDAKPAAEIEKVPRFDLEEFRREYGFFVVPPLICTAIWAMTTFGGYFWPMWVWFGCAVVVLIGIFDDDD